MATLSNPPNETPRRKKYPKIGQGLPNGPYNTSPPIEPTKKAPKIGYNIPRTRRNENGGIGAEASLVGRNGISG